MGESVKLNRTRVAPGLPVSLQAAWGIRSHSEKGPRPGLTLSQIVEAAVGVATSAGLGAVSMSRVASRLGVATMSLYRYVAAKDELLALMVDAAFAASPPTKADSEGWRPAMSGWARAHLAVLRAHPWILRIPVSSPPVLPNQMRWFESGLACFSGAGLPARDQVSALLLVNGFVRNEALLALDLARAAGAHTGAGQAMASYGTLLTGLIDKDRFPAILAVIDAGAFDGEGTPDAEFEFGLARILDGIAANVPRTAASPRR
jgi:AcrR family transcriptional regulator